MRLRKARLRASSLEPGQRLSELVGNGHLGPLHEALDGTLVILEWVHLALIVNELLGLPPPRPKAAVARQRVAVDAGQYAHRLEQRHELVPDLAGLLGQPGRAIWYAGWPLGLELLAAFRRQRAAAQL